MSEKNLKKAEDVIQELTEEEIQEIEKDIRAILEAEDSEAKGSEVVVLDIEAIRVVKPGKYLIDLVNLFSQKPIVIRVAPGKYRIDLSSIMLSKHEP